MKSKHWISIGTIGLAAAWLIVPAWGEDTEQPDPRGQKILERYPEADTNSDGTLDQAEIRAFFDARRGHGRMGKPGAGARGIGGPGMYDGRGPGAPHGPRRTPEEVFATHPEADTDGDGQLSREEMRAFGETQRAQVMADLLAAHPELDTDGDGELSREEHRAGRATIAVFMKANMAERILENHPEADTDGDGTLSEQELDAFREANRPERPHHGVMAVSWMIQNFAQADTNGDGNVTKEELIALQTELTAEAQVAGTQPGPQARSKKGFGPGQRGPKADQQGYGGPRGKGSKRPSQR